MNLQQRSAFSARLRHDVYTPKITDVQLLSCGVILVDSFNKCVKLFTNQGEPSSAHPCNDVPGHLAVIGTDTAHCTHTLVLTLPCCKRLDVLKVTSRCATLKYYIRTTRPYNAVTTINSSTLAVGYVGLDGIDLLDMAGHRLRELTLSVSPLHMVPTSDGGLVCSVGGNTILKIAIDSGQIVYNVTVPQIQFLCGITTHKDGSLIVTDANTHSLHLITSQGAWVRQLWAVPDGTRRHDQLCSIGLDNDTCVCATDEESVFVLEVA